MTISAKKSETIEVRLPFATKRAFAERCRAEGITVSEAVRGFVDGRLRRTSRPLVPLAVLAALGAVAAVSTMAWPPDFTAGFDALDRNGDGVLTAAEVDGKPGGCGVALAVPLKREWLVGRRSFAVCNDSPAFAELDSNGDGLARPEEYAAYREGRFYQSYAALDKNSDGNLSSEEYAAVLKLRFLGDAPKLASFRELDRNRDGLVSWTEYLR